MYNGAPTIMVDGKPCYPISATISAKHDENVACLCETGNPAILIYCAKYVDARVIKGIAKYAGCHLYTETNDVVYANNHYLTYHSSKTENKVIELPRKAFAFELYEKKYYSENSDEIILDMKLGETKMFELK